jgi:hypothetical protein
MRLFLVQNTGIRVHAIVLLTALSFSMTESLNGQPIFIKGVYGNPASVTSHGYRFDSLGINAIFARSSSLSEELVSTAKEQGVSVFVEFPTLNGKGYVEDHPEAWPVNEQGLKAEPADWFMGVCPTDPGFMKYRKTQIHQILNTYEIDGIWLDYLHWHAQFETPEPILPQTCFCGRCIGQFAADKNITPIENKDAQAMAFWILEHKAQAWRDWRCSVVNNWVKEMKLIVEQAQPKAKLGIYFCPWYSDEYDSAMTRVMGLDLKALSQIADVFSPMLYHGKMGRSPEWVKEYIQWLDRSIFDGNKNHPLIWPIVQAQNDPEVMSLGEFRNIMEYGMKPPSDGVMMFTINSLISEPAKLEIMKVMYREN